MFLVGFILSLAVASQAFLLRGTPTVKTSWGDIEGINTQNEDGNSLEAYLGIPFARPPVGDLRFKKPVEHPGFNATFKASSLSPPCIQLGRNGSVDGDENCLYLNVYAPSNKTSASKAVMVWIHGGAFYTGDSHYYNPAQIVTLGDVIVVTVQYRLGPFGFLSTMDAACKGNFGLWDQLFALKWIKKNIGAFGGDQGQITVIGESAGAASIGILSLSPKASGLFQRAILQSGSATSYWAVRRDAKTVTNILAQRVSCNQTDSAKLVDCLRKVPASTLVSHSYPSTDSSLSVVFDVPCGPVVDGEIILDFPRNLLSNPDLLKSSSFPRCVFMLGVNNNESADLHAAAVMTDMQFNTTLAPRIYDVNFFKTDVLPLSMNGFLGSHNQAMVQTAAFEYLYPDLSTVNMQALSDVRNDVAFYVSAVEFARAHASINQGNTYFYYFSHDMKMDFSGFTVKRMVHAYDLLYTFGMNKDITVPFGVRGTIPASERKLSQRFQRILTGFAKSGDPSPAVQPDLTSWPEFDLQTEQYLNVDDTLTLSDHLVQRRVSLWLDLLPKLMD